MKTKTFKSSHNLAFEDAPWERSNDFRRFRIGTVEGLWSCDKKSYNILALVNNDLNNGHFNDVLEWFEMSCKRDRRTLKILETWNPRLKKHLIGKRGFKDIGEDNLEKIF